jgi:alkylation response protein AidB-like acyl-CoA dehydrogenase
MDFSFSAEQEELRSGVRRFLAAKSPEVEVRRTMATDAGYDPALWAQLTEQLGLTALAIPEKFGGAGFGIMELGLVLQEMGRALLCGPFLSSAVLATSALLESGDTTACEEWLPPLAAGTLLATLATSGPNAHEPLTGVRHGDGWRLTGRADLVLDGHLADLILFPVGIDDSVSLFAISGSPDGLERQPVTAFDSTRRLANLRVHECPAVLIGPEGGAGPALSRTLDRAAVGLALESVGVAERALEMATDYAKVREQFGRPIGAFQAVKHKLANVLLEVEAARSAAWYALWAATHRPDELPVVAGIAASTCSEAAYLAATENIQIHGGMGCTWEHPAHLYLRRATTSRQLFGTPDSHRQTMLRRLGYGSGPDVTRT